MRMLRDSVTRQRVSSGNGQALTSTVVKMTTRLLGMLAEESELEDWATAVGSNCGRGFPKGIFRASCVPGWRATSWERVPWRR